MKGWCDLSWNEKRKIEEGNINEFDYLSGYEFRVKVKIDEGITKRENKKLKETKT